MPDQDVTISNIAKDISPHICSLRLHFAYTDAVAPLSSAGTRDRGR